MARKTTGKAKRPAAAPKKRPDAGLRPKKATQAGKNAELIVRQGFIIDAAGKSLHAVPEVVILANADGFRYLSQVFAQLAEAAQSRKAATGDESIKLPRLEHPINAKLSDDLDFRFAPLTAANRRAMFKQFGIDMKSKQTGSLFERYQEVLTHFSRLTNQMKRMGEITPAT